MTCVKKILLAASIVWTLLTAVTFADDGETSEVSPVLLNAGFEQWQDGKPVGWTLNRGTVLVEDLYRMGGKRSLNLQVDRMDQNPTKLPMRIWPYSQLQSDWFSLEPNSQYHLSVWLNMQATSGHLEFMVEDADGVVLGSYDSGWAKDHSWMLITVSIRTRSNAKCKMTVVGRTGFGKSVLLDDIKIEKVGGSTAGASPADRTRGFSLFTRSVMESLDVSSKLPSPAEMVDTLQIRMARGEYEPALLGLYALKDMKGVDVGIAGDLVGPSGARIASKDIVVRRLEVEMLPPTRPRNVKADEILAWWATVKAEKTTAPGVYRGELQVTVSGKVVQKLPLEVEVLDVILPAPDIAFWMYHMEGFVNQEFLTPELRKAYYRDMYEHGMNTVSVYNNADVDGSANVDFSKDTSYPTAAQDPEFPNDHPMRKYGLDTIVPWILESGLCSAGQPLFYLPSRGDVGGKPGYGWGGVPKDALKATLDGWQERKWPELVLYCGDEPASDTGLVPRLKMVKSWFTSVRLTTAGIEPDVLGEYYDVWIQGEAGINRGVVQKAKELGAELWTYNCTAPNNNMPFARAFYGFWAYRTGVKGVAEWAYFDLRGWAADENGDTYGDPKSRHSRVAVSPNGPIPTISWEATREGVDDYRHAQMLRDLTKTAEKRLKELSVTAEKLLSKADREKIDERYYQKLSQHKPGAPVITWEPADAKQARGERFYLAARRMAKEVRFAKSAMGFVMEPIPFDGMVTRVGLNYHMPKWARWCPPMGPGGMGENPVTITEEKRKVLVSYIMALQDAVRAGKETLR